MECHITEHTPSMLEGKQQERFAVADRRPLKHNVLYEKRPNRCLTLRRLKPVTTCIAAICDFNSLAGIPPCNCILC
jgi:hypothetical protein